MAISLPPQTTTTDARAREFIRGLITDAVQETEPQDDGNGNITLVPTGFLIGQGSIAGPDFALIWRWVIDFSIVLVSTGNAGVSFSKIDFVFEGTPMTISFDELTNGVTIRFAEAES